MEYRLVYGADGFLYAEHKTDGTFFVYINAEWQDLDSVYDLMQGVFENNSGFDVDNEEFFSDDYWTI